MVAVVIATPLRMRDVLHAIWAGMRHAGSALRTAAFAFAKFWADVFRAILPEKSRDDDEDDDEEVEEEDVLEANDDERGPEPEIIERTQPSAIEVVELTAEKKKRAKKEAAKTEVDFAVPAPSRTTRRPRRPSLRRRRASSAWPRAPSRRRSPSPSRPITPAR